MPVFAHLPLILKPGGQGKLSKRDGDKMGFPVFPLEWKDPDSGEVSHGYRESGYFPEALINILAFLGWNPGTEQELFSLDELVNSFSMDRVGKSGSRFDPEKAKWFNQQYLKAKNEDELAAIFIKDLQARKIEATPEYVKKVAGMVKDRLVFPQDFWNQAWYFFESPVNYDMQMAKKVWKQDTPYIIETVKHSFQEAVEFSSGALEKLINQYIVQEGIGFGKVAAPLRLLIVGSGMGPHLFDILELMGRDETIRRMEEGITKMKDFQNS
jgi:glutamyl-tRNA synthetase